jgi:hypothetical protein
MTRSIQVGWLKSRPHPAIDLEICTSDVTGSWACEERDGIGNLLKRSDAPHGDLCEHRQHLLLDLRPWRIGGKALVRGDRAKGSSRLMLWAVPGEMVFAVMPSIATALAREDVMAIIAALAAHNRAFLEGGIRPARLEMLTTRPHFASRMAGNSRVVILTAASTLRS